MSKIKLEEPLDLIAIDPGVNTGWAIFHGDRLVEYGVVRTKRKASRELWFMADLFNVLEHSFDVIAYEEFSSYGKPGFGKERSAFVNGVFAGLAIGVATKVSVDCMDVEPKVVIPVNASWKRSKAENKISVIHEYDLPDDLADHTYDAIGMGRSVILRRLWEKD